MLVVSQVYRAGWHGTDVAVKKLRSQGGGERCWIGVGSAATQGGSNPFWDVYTTTRDV